MSTQRPLGMSHDDFQALVHQVNHTLLTTPRCWGDADRLSLGNNVHVANALFNTKSGTISVGDDTFFGHNVCLLTGNHKIGARGKARQYGIQQTGRDIVIGKGVWIASNVTIIGPCTIGDDAVIAAGSLVCGGVLPGGYVYAGAPARSIKPIDFDDDSQGPLDDSRWTDL